jgi:nucleoside phosphorylase
MSDGEILRPELIDIATLPLGTLKEQLALFLRAMEQYDALGVHRPALAEAAHVVHRLMFVNIVLEKVGLYQSPRLWGGDGEIQRAVSWVREAIPALLKLVNYTNVPYPSLDKDVPFEFAPGLLTQLKLALPMLPDFPVADMPLFNEINIVASIPPQATVELRTPNTAIANQPARDDASSGEMSKGATRDFIASLERNVVAAPAPVTSAQPRPDLVLVTVNEHETKAVHDAVIAATGVKGEPVALEGRLYHNLGMINGTTVYHALSEMGSGNLGAMQQTVDKAIRALDPGAVIAVGIAFGVKKKQNIGDVLASRQLRPYDLQRAGEAIVLRDDKPHAATRLINHFGNFAQTEWKGAKIRQGVILTGARLIDDIDYRDQLVKLESEAIGGEMEGAGLYVSSHEHKVDWIVIKAICDWADGKKRYKKDDRQKLAAKNAAEFVIKSLIYAPLKRLDAVVRVQPRP